MKVSKIEVDVIVNSTGAPALTLNTGAVVWTSDNDGINSGLDADTIAGVPLSELSRRTTSAVYGTGNTPTGVLINTKLPVGDNGMYLIKLVGQSLGDPKPVNTDIALYNHNLPIPGALLNTNVRNNGVELTIDLFYLNNEVHLYVHNIPNSLSMSVIVLDTNNNVANPPIPVISEVSVIPTAGVVGLVRPPHDNVVSTGPGSVGIDASTLNGLTAAQLSKGAKYKSFGGGNAGTTGVLIDTQIAGGGLEMLRIELRGYAYGLSSAVNTDVVVYNEITTAPTLLKHSVTNYGVDLDIKMFYLNNTVHLYVNAVPYFFNLTVKTVNTRGLSGTALPDVIMSELPAIPTAGVTGLVTPTSYSLLKIDPSNPALNADTISGVPITEIARQSPYTGYNIRGLLNVGLLIDTRVKNGSSMMARVELKGYTYGANNIINTEIAFHARSSLIRTVVHNHGVKLSITLFEYLGNVYAHIADIPMYFNVSVSVFDVTNNIPFIDTPVCTEVPSPPLSRTNMATPTHINTAIEGQLGAVDATTIASVPLSGIARQAAYTGYNTSGAYTVGLLIDTKVAYGSGMMARLEVKGYAYANAEIVNTEIVFQAGGRISNAAVHNHGSTLVMDIFSYLGNVHIYIRNIPVYFNVAVSVFNVVSYGDSFIGYPACTEAVNPPATRSNAASLKYSKTAIEGQLGSVNAATLSGVTVDKFARVGSVDAATLSGVPLSGLVRYSPHSLYGTRFPANGVLIDTTITPSRGGRCLVEISGGIYSNDGDAIRTDITVNINNIAGTVNLLPSTVHNNGAALTATIIVLNGTIQVYLHSIPAQSEIKVVVTDRTPTTQRIVGIVPVVTEVPTLPTVGVTDTITPRVLTSLYADSLTQWHPLTLIRGWTVAFASLGGSTTVPSYRVHPGGIAELAGFVTNQAGLTNNVIATLPYNVRPINSVGFTSSEPNVGAVRLVIRTTGDILIQGAGAVTHLSTDLRVMYILG